MKRRITILSMVFVLALWTAASPLMAQGHIPKKDILLKATLRDAPEDMIRSDNRGPYFNGRDLEVYLLTDGSIRFYVGPQSGRRVYFYFPTANRIRPVLDTAHPNDPKYIDKSQYCLYYDESVNPPETEILEPTRDTVMQTYNGSGFAPPQYDLSSMIPGQVVQVRFWLHFCTYNRTDFFIAENERICDKEGFPPTHGYVWVKAIDMDGNSTTVERWEFTPWNPENMYDPLYKGWGNLWRQLPYRGGVSRRCDYGDFKMPFTLWLDRVK